MNNENLDFLKERLFFLGFGDNLHKDLEKKIAEKPDKFTLSFQGEFPKGEQKNIVNYSLDFSKSKQNDMYFVNNYTATLKNDDPQKERTQKFYLKNGSGVTAKEAYNLLDGRAVFKNNLINKKDEKYEAWLQVDFGKQNDQGNYKIQPYHKAWNYDLEKSLQKHPIKELENVNLKDQIIKSLERGNIAYVTFQEDGKTSKMFLEANPKDRNLIVYDEQMNKQFQGVRQHKPVQKEAETSQSIPSKTLDHTQGMRGHGAAGINAPESNDHAKTTANARTAASETNSMRSNDINQEGQRNVNSRAERESTRIAPPENSKQKRKGLSA